MRTRDIATTSLAIALLGGVWWIDRRTGTELSLDLLYLLPILGVATFASLPATLVTAGVAAALSFAVEMAEHNSGYLAIPFWNGCASLFIYVGFGLLVRAFLLERHTLKKTIQRLEKLISAEAQRAKLDRLTGLANTRSFLTATRETLARADAHGQSVCLAVLNLEPFDRLNQAYGYEASSSLLIDLSVRLTDIFGSPCTVARLGGGKFAVLFPDGHLAQAELLGLGCAEAVQTLGADYPEAPLSLSVGIVRSTPGQDPQELLGIGDAIAHEAKTGGGPFHCLVKDLGHAVRPWEGEVQVAGA